MHLPLGIMGFNFPIGKNLNSGFGMEKRVDKVFRKICVEKGVFDGNMLASVCLDRENRRKVVFLEKRVEMIFFWGASKRCLTLRIAPRSWNSLFFEEME